VRLSNGRRVRQLVLVVTAAIVLLGVNVPPAWSYIRDWRHEQLVNSAEYMHDNGHWDTLTIPATDRVNAIHAALLSTGKVLLIAGSGNKEDMFATRALKSMIYDPATGSSRVIPVPDDMFCGGQTMLPDGRLLFAGGTQRYEKLDGAVTNAAGAMTVKNENPDAPYVLPQGAIFVSPTGQRFRATQSVALPPAAKQGRGRGTRTVASEKPVFVEALVPGPTAVTDTPAQYQVEGLPPAQARNVYGQGQAMTLRKQDFQGTNQAYTFDPRTETWSRVPDMEFQRWYPTLTPMSNGRVLTMSGLDGVGQVLNGQTEIFDPVTNTWTERKDLQRYFPTYPAVFETAQADQMVYTGANAGYGPADQGRAPGLWNLDTGAFTTIPGMRDPDLLETAGSAWIGPVQDQRLAVVGGGGIGESPRSTGRIDMLDLRDPAPHFTPGPTLPEGVRYPNLVNLPDDTTLIADGSRDYRGKGASNNHIAQILHPDTGALTPVADPTVGRDYHGEALLLPDGRVLTARRDLHAALPVPRGAPDRHPGADHSRAGSDRDRRHARRRAYPQRAAHPGLDGHARDHDGHALGSPRRGPRGRRRVGVHARQPGSHAARAVHAVPGERPGRALGRLDGQRSPRARPGRRVLTGGPRPPRPGQPRSASCGTAGAMPSIQAAGEPVGGVTMARSTPTAA
jgi:hypothetical protein